MVSSVSHTLRHKLISKYLFQRNSIWYLQFRIPAKIQPQFNDLRARIKAPLNPKLRLSLRTQDYKQAWAIAIPVVGVLSQIVIARPNKSGIADLSNQLGIVLFNAGWKFGEDLTPLHNDVQTMNDIHLKKVISKTKNSVLTDLAYLHEITTITAALNFYCNSKMETGEWTEKARKSSQSKYKVLHELFGKWKCFINEA